jgi:hypothetical protein
MSYLKLAIPAALIGLLPAAPGSGDRATVFLQHWRSRRKDRDAVAHRKSRQA